MPRSPITSTVRSRLLRIIAAEMTQVTFKGVIAEAATLIAADRQVSAIKLLQEQCSCGPFRARAAVDMLARTLAKGDPKVIPFR